jgi:hypothetical protein
MDRKKQDELLKFQRGFRFEMNSDDARFSIAFDGWLKITELKLRDSRFLDESGVDSLRVFINDSFASANRNLNSGLRKFVTFG